MNYMDEVPRHRKKKPQVSDSRKRSDHKHVYEKTITMHINRFDPELRSYHWSTHCSICGRGRDFIIGNDEFRKQEFRGRNLFADYEMYLPYEEIVSLYPDVPIYANDPDAKEDIWAEKRVR